MSDYNHTKGDMANDTTQIKDMPDRVTYENRIKAALADKKKTNKWLAEQLGKDPATISKWCTNVCQPPMETYINLKSASNLNCSKELEHYAT